MASVVSIDQAEEFAELSRQDLQELVDHTRLACGQIVITVHEYELAKVEIHPRYSIHVGRGRGRKQTAQAGPRTASVCLDGVEPFVKARLAPAIRAQVGGFGSLTIEAEDRRIAEWSYQIRKK